MKSKMITCLLMLLTSTAMFAQKVTVTGTVSDEIGPVIGVSVIEKGTVNGTTTDLDGKYSISVSKDAVLEFSSIGYATQEIAVAGKSVINVVLSEDAEFLDEVVVVGYGTMKKSDLAGASVSMKEDDLKGSIISSLDQSLQGRAAGVTAITTSGAPGSSSSIRVRGQATINANAEPLYVIDGVIVQGGGNSGADFGLGDALGNGKVSTISPLSTINPADIVSMEILKDASATAIYGAQGANGVILITTKHGKAGDAKFSYDGMVAAARQTKRLDVMNLREYAQFYNTMVTEGEIYEGSAYYATPSLLGKGTNWQDEIFQTAFQHQHQLSAQGGSEKVQYFVSGSWMNQEGTIIGSEFNRFSVRANLDAQLKKWMKLGVNVTYANTKDNLKLADSNEGIIFYSLTSTPDRPVYDVNGNFASTITEGVTSPNPVALAMNKDILLNRQKLQGNIYTELTPVKHFVLRTELGFDINNSKAVTYEPIMLDVAGNIMTGFPKTNGMREQINLGKFWQFKNYLTYSNSFGKHSITAMLGQECWESTWDYMGVNNTKLPSDVVRNIALAGGTPNVSGGFGSSAMASFFTRETYNYDDRYLLTYTYRYDGSSNFGPRNRWAGFHSVAAAWRFTNEKSFEFLKGVINNGKLRLGWGQTGNANIGGYAWGSSISRMDSALGTGYRPANIANDAIRWESQEQWNVGLDLSFLQSKINLTVDAYYKKSDDMLMRMQLPSYMGTSGNGSSALAAPKGNYGSIENKGLEITLDTHPVDRTNFSWDSNFQISFNRNKLVSLTDTENASLIGYGQWSDVVSVSEIGKPLYNFYGYVVDGVYKDIDDIQNSPRAEKYPSDGTFSRSNTVWVGDLKFKDINEDGEINEKDRTVIGNPLPDFTLGWTNTFRYKNFDLSIFLNGSFGNDVLNYNAITLTHMNSPWTNQLNSVSSHARLVPADGVYSDGWYNNISNVVVENPSTKTPRATLSDPNDNDRISDRYIEDGSYIRIKNITLGYNVPKSVLNRFKVENIRLYMNIQNLYTFTKYSGYDPEVGASTQDSSGLVYGLDNGRYPSPTLYSFGVNVSF